MSSGPTDSSLVRTIGAHRGALLRSCSSTETQTREMSEERSGGRAPSSSIGSSRGSTWRERRQKRREDREHPRGKERSRLGDGSAQTHRTVSGVSAHRQYDDRDRELERLRRLIMDLELEARGRRQERNHNPRQRRNHVEEGFSRSGTQRFQNRSRSQESRRHSRETRHQQERSQSHGYDDRGSGITGGTATPQCCHGRHEPSLTNGCPIAVFR